MKLDLHAIRQFLTRQEAGASYVYKKTYRLVYSVCFDVLRHPQDAEDAAMQAYENVLGAHTYFKDDKAFVSFLCVAAKNAALNMAKKRDRIDEIEDEEAVVGEEDGPEDDALLATMKGLLGDEDYELVILHLCHDLSFPVIASIQGGGASSCRGRYFRAMKKLRQNIREEDFR